MNARRLFAGAFLLVLPLAILFLTPSASQAAGANPLATTYGGSGEDIGDFGDVIENTAVHPPDAVGQVDGESRFRSGAARPHAPIR